jgi:hypothetical protein
VELGCRVLLRRLFCSLFKSGVKVLLGVFGFSSCVPKFFAVGQVQTLVLGFDGIPS